MVRMDANCAGGVWSDTVRLVAPFDHLPMWQPITLRMGFPDATRPIAAPPAAPRLAYGVGIFWRKRKVWKVRETQRAK